MSPSVVGVALVAAALTFTLRIWPRLRVRDFGVDTWYYLTYARAWRRDRRWPVRIPFYILDDPEQVYPPALPWLLARLPTGVLERWHWCVSATIDALHCLVLCVLAASLAPDALPAAAVAGALFATSPVLLAQATDLNARPLGNLTMTVFMLTLWAVERGGGMPALSAAVATGLAVLWTHKMSTQQMVAILLAWTALHRDLRYVAPALAMVAVSLAVSRGWFLQMARGHREIVTFWRRNLPWLGAHLVYQSPLFDDHAKASAKRGVSGIRGSAVPRALAVGHLAAIALLVLHAGTPSLSADVRAFAFRWSVVVFVTIAATTWIPLLTQFGEGFKYLRYGVFPWSLLLAVWVSGVSGPWAWTALAVVIAAQSVVSLHALRAQRHNTLAAVHGDVRDALVALRTAPGDGVLALPVTHCEAIAYFAEKRVLWGAHGLGWERIEPFFPVLRRPVEAFFEQYALTWLWIDDRYVDVDDLRLPAGRFTSWVRCGHIALYRYAAEAPSEIADANAARPMSSVP